MTPLSTMFITPVKDQRYRVVKEAHKGRTGVCTDTKESDFGHKWAYLEFDDRTGDYDDRTKASWVRTVLIEPIEDEHGESFTVDQRTDPIQQMK